MKITFLGTGNGVPDADRYCAGTSIEVGGSVYLIDAGIPVVNAFLENEVPLDCLRAVFITHGHGDHVGGLPHFCDLLCWYYKEIRPSFYIPDERVKQGVDAWKMSLSGCETGLDFRIIDKGVFYEDENIKITAIPNMHLETRPSYCFVVEAEGRRIFFSGDLKYKLPDLPDMLFDTHTDLVVFEGAHNNILRHTERLYKVDTDLFALNHISARANNREDFAKFSEGAPYRCTYSADGDILEY